MVAFKDDKVSRHRLVTENFNDLAQLEVLPAVVAEDSLDEICCEHLLFVLIFVLLMALAVFEQVLESRCHNYNDKGVSHCWSPVCIAHSWNYLQS